MFGILALVPVVAVSIWWKVAEPTPRPMLRRAVTYSALFMLVFLVGAIVELQRAVEHCAIAIGSALTLTVCLFLETVLTEPRAEERVVELPRARIVS